MKNGLLEYLKQVGRNHLVNSRKITGESQSFPKYSVKDLGSLFIKCKFLLLCRPADQDSLIVELGNVFGGKKCTNHKGRDLNVHKLNTLV